MALPSFKTLAARRRAKEQEQEKETVPTTGDGTMEADRVVGGDILSERTLTPTYTPGVNIKEATKTRKTWIIISSLFFLISVVFLVLVCTMIRSPSPIHLTQEQVEIGNINNKDVIRSTYFYKLNLSNIIPASTGDIVFVNSIARSLGLYDFYQVGLWNFCQGYNNEGIVNCSSPKTLYWFNPVEILLNELLSGATIALPSEINTILNLVRIISHLMFGFFLTGVCMNFVSIFIAPLAIYSRWWSLPLTIWTFIAALLTTAAAIIGTVYAIVFRNVLTSQTELNIGCSLGVDMFAFMWVGSAFSIFGFAIHFCLLCCCASRRDVKSGRRKGRASAYGDAQTDEKKSPLAGGMRSRMPKFGRKKTAGEVV